MNKSIYLNEDEVNKILEKLIEKRKKLIELLETQKNIREKMHVSWSGTSGDKAYEAFKKHEKKYEIYLNAINKRIIFLERVKRAYINIDNYLNNKIDEKIKIEV